MTNTLAEKRITDSQITDKIKQKAREYRIKSYEKFNYNGRRKVDYIYSSEIEGDFRAGALYGIQLGLKESRELVNDLYEALNYLDDELKYEKLSLRAIDFLSKEKNNE